MSTDVGWLDVGPEEDLTDGEMMAVEIGDHSLALYQVEGTWYCTSNICTHGLALLTDGWLDEHVIECPLHSGQFDIRTGAGLCEPIEEDLPVYPVKVEDGRVLVSIGSREEQ